MSRRLTSLSCASVCCSLHTYVGRWGSRSDLGAFTEPSLSEIAATLCDTLVCSNGELCIPWDVLKDMSCVGVPKGFPPLAFTFVFS